MTLANLLAGMIARARLPDTEAEGADWEEIVISNIARHKDKCETRTPLRRRELAREGEESRKTWTLRDPAGHPPAHSQK